MSKRCPLCGSEHEPRGWEVSTFRDYHQTAFGEAAPPTEFKEWRRSSPVRAPSLQADVWVPAAIAGISGLFTAAFTIPFVFAWPLPWWSPFISGLGIAGIVWGILQGAGRKLLFASETIIGHDLNRDGAVGKPMDEWRIEITEKDEKGNAKAMRFLYPPRGVSPDQFSEYVRAVLGGGGLGYDRWVGDGPFSRSQYDHILSELRRLGYAKNYGGRRGHELTAQGQAVFKWLALGKP